MRFFRLCLVMATFAVVLVNPRRLWHNLIVPSPDDFNYLAHATSLVYGEFPSYGREFARYTPVNHAPGASLLAAPFVFAFSLVDRARNAPIVEFRTQENLQPSWTVFGFVIATQFYLMFGILMIYLALRDGFGLPRPALATLACVLSTGLPVYAWWRPVSAHVHEFAVIATAIRVLIATLNREDWTRPVERIAALATGLPILLFLVRYNDILLSFALAWALLRAHHSVHPWPPRRYRITMACVLAAVAAVPCATYVFVRSMALSPGGYAPHWSGTLWNQWSVQSRFFSIQPPIFYFERIVHVFLGRDWGLIYSAPLILIGLAGLRRAGAHRRLLGVLALALAPNFYMIVSWGTNASYYGYRYFVYAALPLAIVGLAAWWDRGPENARLKAAAIGGLALFSTALMLVFRAAPAFDILRGNTRWAAGRINPTYASNVLSALLLDPLTYARAVFDTGLGLLAEIRHPVVLARFALIAAVPVLFGLSWMLWERRRSSGPRG